MCNVRLYDCHSDGLNEEKLTMELSKKGHGLLTEIFFLIAGENRVKHQGCDLTFRVPSS